jgi:DNA-binding SARP family transcriptional activator
MKDWDSMGTRVLLCGRVAIVGEDRTIDERELPGRQGRLALALLCGDGRRPVAVERIVDVLWDEQPPPDAAGALASIMSKLRAILRAASAADPGVISAGVASYQLRLPTRSSVDVEDARNAIDQAEGARRRADEGAAWAAATVAVTIARRGFLAGESAPWAVAVRRELDGVARRGYDCLSWVWTIRDQGVLATAMAEHAVRIEPFHEPGWRTLMRAQAQFGSRADAITTYRRCRELLRSELGVEPDGETDRLLEQIMSR